MRRKPRGLGDHIKRPLEDRRRGRRSTFLGERTDHDRPAGQASLAEGPQHADAIEAWHLHIEGEHIRMERRHHLHGLVAVFCHPHHVDLRNPAEHIEEHLAIERRVVNNEHSDRCLTHGISNMLPASAGGTCGLCRQGGRWRSGRLQDIR